MNDKAAPRPDLLKKEVAIFTTMLFLGCVLLPVVIWLVGKFVFGAYGGAGYGDFFGDLSAKLRSGELAAWFLVLSPWLALQVIRLALLGWRQAGKT